MSAPHIVASTKMGAITKAGPIPGRSSGGGNSGGGGGGGGGGGKSAQIPRQAPVFLDLNTNDAQNLLVAFYYRMRNERIASESSRVSIFSATTMRPGPATIHRSSSEKGTGGSGTL